MGKQGDVGDRFRQRLRAERERRGWSQGELARRLIVLGVDCYTTTVAKVEAGTRSVRIDEIDALATVFGISVDVLIGRSRRTADLAWAVSKLTSNAEKIVGEIVGLRRRLTDDLADAAAVGHLDVVIAEAGSEATRLMVIVESMLTQMSNQFPIPTNTSARHPEEGAGPKVAGD